MSLTETEDDFVKLLGFWLQGFDTTKHSNKLVMKMKTAMTKLINMVSKQPLMHMAERRHLFMAIVRGAGKFGWELIGNSRELIE